MWWSMPTLTLYYTNGPLTHSLFLGDFSATTGTERAGYKLLEHQCSSLIFAGSRQVSITGVWIMDQSCTLGMI